MRRPGNVIINSPFVVPQRHSQQRNDGALALIEGRRPARYEICDVRNNRRRVEVLEQVNEVRSRVNAWPVDDYPGVTAATRQLLAHWHDQTAGVRIHSFSYCQLEAAETQIWWVEAAASYQQGVCLQDDGGSVRAGAGQAGLVQGRRRHPRRSPPRLPQVGRHHEHPCGLDLIRVA